MNVLTSEPDKNLPGRNKKWEVLMPYSIKGRQMKEKKGIGIRIKNWIIFFLNVKKTSSKYSLIQYEAHFAALIF